MLDTALNIEHKKVKHYEDLDVYSGELEEYLAYVEH